MDGYCASNRKNNGGGTFWREDLLGSSICYRQMLKILVLWFNDSLCMRLADQLLRIKCYCKCQKKLSQSYATMLKCANSVVMAGERVECLG